MNFNFVQVAVGRDRPRHSHIENVKLTVTRISNFIPKRGGVMEVSQTV